MAEYKEVVKSLRICADVMSKCEKCPRYTGGGDACYLQLKKDAADAIEALEEKAVSRIPAADVAPVVHGHWVNETDRINHWHCSNCEYVIGLKWSEYHYCPKCGARMDEEVDE